MFISINKSKDSFSILLFPLLYFVPLLLRESLNNYVSKNIYDLLNYLAFSSLFIFYFRDKKVSIKNKRKKGIKAKNFSKNKIIFILLSMIFLIIYNFLNIFFNLKKQNVYKIRKIMQMFFLFLNNSLFFKKTIYIHHNFSIFIIFIIIIAQIIKLKLQVVHQIISNMISNFCYAFSILLIKYINYTYFLSIFLLGSMLGLIEFTMELSNMLIKNCNLIQEYNSIDNKLWIFILFFAHLSIHFMFHYLIMKFNPIHSYISSSFAYTIYNLIINFKNQNIFELILDLIMLFACMVYLEILELNCCSMNYNLKKTIHNRAIKEIENIIDNDSSLESQ